VKTNYYYLIASLPDLILDENKNSFSFSEIIRDIFDQVQSYDLPKIKPLLYHYDNRNLIARLEKEEIPHNDRGVLSEDELKEEIKHPTVLPAYMKAFLQAYEDEKYAHSELLLKDQLNWLFYQEMTQSSNKFLKEWFCFNLDLRNVVSGINSRKLKIEFENNRSAFLLKKVLICDNDVTQKIKSSKEPDFSLSADLPWIETLLKVEQEDLVAFEKEVDNLRWEKLNEMTRFSYFHIETVQAFIVKLEMVTRWQNLEPEIGKTIFQKLLSEVKTGYDIQQTFP